MEITPTPNVTATTGTPTPSESPKAVISSDFETFLKMLTAQMQNQDPLNPVDSTDFATQLATFSSVEQQVLTNDLLTALSTQMGAMSVSQLAGWVGMDARAVMPVKFQGSPVSVMTQGNDLADAAELVVKDATGREVQRLTVPTDSQEFDWAGVGENGQPLQSGTYVLSTEYFSNEELIETAPVTVEARIVEARNQNGTPLLVMATGQEVSASDILGLKQPGS